MDKWNQTIFKGLSWSLLWSFGRRKSKLTQFQSGSALGVVTFLLWPPPSWKFNYINRILGVFTWEAIKIVLLQWIFTLPFVLKVWKKYQHFINSFSHMSAWMKQAVPQLYFKLLFLFPTHCSQQPLPRAGWPLIDMEYPSPACSGRDAPATRMFVPLAGQGKRNFWNDLDKK